VLSWRNPTVLRVFDFAVIDIVSRAPLGAQGLRRGGINPRRGRRGRRGTFNVLQLLCVCHTPFNFRLGFCAWCTGFQW